MRMLTLKTLKGGRHAAICLFTAVPFFCASMRASPLSAVESTPAVSAIAVSDLPDSPDYATSVQAPSEPVSPRPGAALTPVSKSKLVIKAGEVAPPLTASDKFAFAARSALSPMGFVGSLASAGLSHATDSRPHFGTDRAGFGERLGATVYRSDVRALFGFGVFPVLFHDDPRYYALGDAAAFKRRVLYAATRIVIARKDNGERGINYPRLLAPVMSQGSANGFYPSRDQQIGNTITGILTSYASSAGGDELKEFREDILRRLHLRH